MINEVKMEKIIILAIVSVLMIGLIGLSGCVGQAPPPEPVEKEGFTGLSVEFATSAPPSTLYVDELFDVILTVKNEGGYDVNPTNTTNKSAVFVHGVDLSVYGGSNNTNTVTGKGYLMKVVDFDLPKATVSGEDTIPGGIGDVNLGILTRGSSGIAEGGKTEDKFFATVCYNYQTEDKSKVCLGKEGFEETATEEACEPGTADKPTAVGTGSPIRVTSVEVYPLSTGTNFIIDIENKGEGDVFWTASMTNWGKCLDLGHAELNKVNIVSIKAGADEICSNDYKTVSLKEEGGKITGQIRCTESNLSTDLISSPTPKDLVVTLEYYYKDQASKDVTAKRAG